LMFGLPSSHICSETCDILFGGKLKINQEMDGYRFSIDAILLATFTWLKKNEKVIDLGTGVGIIPLMLGKRDNSVEQIVGIEIQAKLAALAQKNVFINGLKELIQIYQADIRVMNDVSPSSAFDVVVTNPPYYRVSSGRINPVYQKAIARHEISCTLDDVLKATVYLLKEGGRIFLIFPAHRAITLLNSLRRFTLEPKRLRWVYSREGGEAKFILTEAHKSGGEGVEVLPPLFLYAQDGKYSPEIEAVYSGATIH
jgi:tRNA1Val (adenine37-N6)-methyltransferase